MTIEEKYSKLKDIFFKDFIVTTEETTCRGTNIPASKVTKSVRLDKKSLYWYDGTINMAEYLHYLLIESLEGYFFNDNREFRADLMMVENETIPSLWTQSCTEENTIINYTIKN